MQTDFCDEFARIPSALAAPSRLRLLDRLCQGEQTVDQLAAATGLSVSNASRQLRILAEAGLASVRREPPFVFYQVASDEVVDFWFALRDLARKQLAEVDRAVTELLNGAQPTPMTRAELIVRMQTGEVFLLDVRPAAEYRLGHIPGAISVPLEELDSRLASLSLSSPIVAYCRGPYCMLAVDAVRKLRSRGLDAVRLEEGLPEWRAASLPVERSSGGIDAHHR